MYRGDILAFEYSPSGVLHVLEGPGHSPTLYAYDPAADGWIKYPALACGCWGGFGATTADLSFNSAGVPHIAVSANGGNVYVFALEGASWVQLGAVRALNDAPGPGPPPESFGHLGTEATIVHGPGDALYVAYPSTSFSLGAVVKRYDAAARTWSSVGALESAVAGIADGSPSSVCPSASGCPLLVQLALGLDGTPFISFQVNFGQASTPVTVRRFNGSVWQTLGGCTPLLGVRTQLVVGPDGTPCVAMGDGAEAERASVFKYSAASDSWASIGPRGFSDGRADSYDLAFDASGTPHVAYIDTLTYINHDESVTESKYGVVKRFDGTGWTTLGKPLPPIFWVHCNCDVFVRNPRLAVSPQGVLFRGYTGPDINDGRAGTIYTEWLTSQPPVSSFERFNSTCWRVVLSYQWVRARAHLLGLIATVPANGEPRRQGRRRRRSSALSAALLT